MANDLSNVILSSARILEKLRVLTVMGIAKGFHKLENLMRISLFKEGIAMSKTAGRRVIVGKC